MNLFFWDDIIFLRGGWYDKNTKQITVEVNEILLQEISKITNDENNILTDLINESIVNYILENKT